MKKQRGCCEVYWLKSGEASFRLLSPRNGQHLWPETHHDSGNLVEELTLKINDIWVSEFAW